MVIRRETDTELQHSVFIILGTNQDFVDYVDTDWSCDIDTWHHVE